MDAIDVFAANDWVVRLPPGWAAPSERPRVEFTRHDRMGWHVQVVDDAGPVASFPWYDHVDRLLRTGDSGLPPVPSAAGDQWSDLEQGWWLTVTQVADEVFVAETSFDALVDAMDARPQPAAEPAGPGRVRVGQATVSFHRIAVAVWRQAWDSAITDFRSRGGGGTRHGPACRGTRPVCGPGSPGA